MAERQRIAHYFAPLAAAEAGSFGLTDDAAILTPSSGRSLVVTTDSVIEGIHVLPGARAADFAQKLMRRNLSDLAAMGAAPWRYSVNLHTPRGLPDAWFAEFAGALFEAQQQFGLVLLGGDSTSGSGGIHTTMTCLGMLDGPALRRNGAVAGDDLYVSGSIGGAAYALFLLQHHQPVPPALAARYHRPEPRLALGEMLRSIASSAIDLSDGLLADLAQLAATSNVAARLDRAALPLPPELLHAVAHDAAYWRFALHGGDDYELGFTAPVAKRAAIARIAHELGLALTRVGRIVAGEGIGMSDANGNSIPVDPGGWEHA